MTHTFLQHTKNQSEIKEKTNLLTQDNHQHNIPGKSRHYHQPDTYLEDLDPNTKGVSTFASESSQYEQQSLRPAEGIFLWFNIKIT